MTLIDLSFHVLKCLKTSIANPIPPKGFSPWMLEKICLENVLLHILEKELRRSNLAGEAGSEGGLGEKRSRKSYEIKA